MLQLFGRSAGQVIVVALVLGAGLPALYAVGLRLMVLGGGVRDEGADGGTAATAGAGNPALRVLGLLCFVTVVLAVALGITVIVGSGFGKAVSFEHVIPTLVDK